MDLDLKRLLEILWRKMWLIILCFLIGGAAAGSITKFLITPIYSSSATMYVNNTNNRGTNPISTSDITASQQLVDTYIVIMKSDAVLQAVAEKSGLGYTANQIRSMISANSENGTEVFRLVVENANPEHAQIIANTIAEIAPQEIIRVVKAGSVEVIDYAKLPTAPSSPNLPMNIVIGCLLGLIIAVGIALVHELFDTTIKSEKDLTDAFQIPIIGKIPVLLDDTIK